MGKWKALLPVILALVIAGVGSGYLYKWLGKRSDTMKIVKSDAKTMPVVVAGKEIAWGTKLKPQMVKTAEYLEASFPTGCFHDTDALVGRIVTASLKPNEPILESKLAPVDVKVGGVAAILKPGKRAIAVKGDKVIGLSGLIRPGNMVDVFVTIRDPRYEREITKLVLEKVPVLATGTEIEEGAGGPAPVDVYTLEVSPENGEKLALSATRGKLQFALRNATDMETVLTKGATIPKTLASLSPGPGPVKPKDGKKAVRKVTPKTFSLEVIRDGKVVVQRLDY